MHGVVTWSTRGWHPWVVIAVWIVIAGALAAGPKLQSVTSNDASKSLPATVESKQGYALLERHFPQGSLAPTSVIMELPQTSPEATVGATLGALSQSPGVASAFPTGRADNGRLLSFQVIYEGDPYDKARTSTSSPCRISWRSPA